MSSTPCHTPGEEQDECSLPWATDLRAGAKNELLEYAVEHPEGASVVVATRTVLDTNTDSGEADHRLALRFYQNHPDLFKTDRRDGLVWVWPRSQAFTCSANKHSPKHGEGGGSSENIPKQNARNALARRQVVKTDGSRAHLLGTLATYRETTEDRFHRLDRVRGDGPEHLLVPYSTRFNSAVRVDEAQERFSGAFNHAARQFDCGVLVTLTTDPSRFESLLAATESLMEDVARLKSWLATDSRLGSRPPSVVVPEFTDAGVPHAHVLLFGVSWVVPHPVLSAYWSDSRNRGEVVWFDRLKSRGKGGQWKWADDGPEDAAGRSPRDYLKKMLDGLDGLARKSPEEVREAAQALRQANESDASTDRINRSNRVENDDISTETVDSEALSHGREWWKLALYWATDTRLFTTSPDLKEPDGNNDILHVPCYRYVGTARLGDFPGFVREKGTVVVRSGKASPPAPPPKTKFQTADTVAPVERDPSMQIPASHD